MRFATELEPSRRPNRTHHPHLSPAPHAMLHSDSDRELVPCHSRPPSGRRAASIWTSRSGCPIGARRRLTSQQRSAAWMAAVLRGHFYYSTRNTRRHIPLTVAKIQLEVLALIFEATGDSDMKIKRNPS